ncbi:MAG: hypothetical protein Kow0056_12230 [Coriobacteriia bacterium]
MKKTAGHGGGRDPLARYRVYGDSEEAVAARRQQHLRRAGAALFFIAVIAFAAGWNPPVGSLHRFTELSDYDSETESGCTNSGEGCHGTETAYKDFNDYHPNHECTDCHEYEGVGCIPCHSPKQHECPVCHDGSMENAPDTVHLTDDWPEGHYRESTHTAMGTDMNAVVRAAEGGAASATCGDCHSRDLRDSHTGVPLAPGSDYGSQVGCWECHNDVRSYGMAEVLDDWPERKCESCHKEDASAPMHEVEAVTSIEASGTLTCGETGEGCHAGNDLHSFHPDAPETCSGSAADGEPGCHVLEIEAHAPDSRTCGGEDPETCHRSYVNDDYSHEHDAELHSPRTNVPASDTTFFGVACGSCHRMAPDGTSLVKEHAVWTSSRSKVPDDVCANCHLNPESLEAIEDDWSARDTDDACFACHGEAGSHDPHQADLSSLHDVGASSTRCADTGAGCHPTGDLMEVGAPTTTGNLHSTCLRCHDWTASGGNRSFDPTKRSCGSGRDCHSVEGQFDPDTALHTIDGATVGGTDALHEAGTAQREALYVDSASGVATACSACHQSILGDEHARPNCSLAFGRGTLCGRCHNASQESASVVKGSWQARDTEGACAACHGTSMHAVIEAAHKATQIDRDGEVREEYCSLSGCHATGDLRQLHDEVGCTISGCHTATGDIRGANIKTCGGDDPATSCHVTRHDVDHDADLEGEVNGVSYDLGENVGCFGCHEVSLVGEHYRSFGDGMEGTAGTICGVCHYSKYDDSPGTFADLPAVTSAIENRDKRCVACHASGTRHDGPASVASPHKDTSEEDTLPAGKVWDDPFQAWKTAFESPAGGGGHNSVSAIVVGAWQSRVFPGTSFTIYGDPYAWTLPLNEGSTEWLRRDVYGAAAETTEGIMGIHVRCDDCHVIPEEAAGPHGAAVKVYIDPEYSQTEYANPTVLANQWAATGTDRVICMKCHNMQWVDGVSTPGGNAVHSRHYFYSHRYDPPYDPDDPTHGDEPLYHGAKCIDCHVRIPHAWKRPRLLVRTIGSPGNPADSSGADSFPYVRRDHDGLLGIVLKDYDGAASYSSRSCAVGGCYGRDARTRGHPKPSDLSTDTVLWP